MVFLVWVFLGKLFGEKLVKIDPGDLREKGRVIVYNSSLKDVVNEAVEELSRLLSQNCQVQYDFR